MTWMLEVEEPAEVLLARDGLLPHKDQLKERLWTVALDQGEKTSRRFRALTALAVFDVASPRWRTAGGVVVGELLTANPLYLGAWVKALRPARSALLEPLREVFTGKKLAEHRMVAATVLLDYAADNPDLVVELLMDAEPKQYALLHPLLDKHRTLTKERMLKQLTVTDHEWKDAPLNKDWTEPSADLKQEIEKASGLLTERFVLCQTLPLERLTAVAEALRKSDYRPIRVRPWSREDKVCVAVVWSRDGREWRLEVDRAKADLKAADGEMPVDVACYRVGDEERFAAVWVKALAGESARFYANVPTASHKDATDVLKNDGFVPTTIQALTTADGLQRFSGVWSKGKGQPALWSMYWDGGEPDHNDRVKLGEPLLMDAAVYPSGKGRPLDEEPDGGRERRYASVWQTRMDFDGTGLQGLKLEEHLTRCRELSAAGWRPVGLSAATGSGGVMTASVWQRPRPTPLEREAVARTQAQAAMTLLQLGDGEPVWPLLKASPQPETRSQLLAKIGQYEVSPKLLVERLEKETDDSARAALIVGLGEFTEPQLGRGERERLTAKLLGWYRDDADAGVHGAIDWLLRHGKEGLVARPLDWGVAKELEKIDTQLRRRDPDATKRWYVNGQGQTMVLFPGPHEFRMGAVADESRPDQKAERLHLRRIERNFAVASKPVTVSEWERFVKDRPEVKHIYTKTYSPESSCPIIGVTWFEAAQYCNWLSEVEGIPETEWCYPKKIEEGMKPVPNYLSKKGYRLPTEAECERACRAGAESSRYYGSSIELLPRYSWYLENAKDRTWPVGQKRPNDGGMHDMHGNVWTWCPDPAFYYTNTIYISDKEDNKDLEDRLSRVLRGGSFGNQPPDVRAACRNYVRPSNRDNAVGVRPARTYD
jgi:hypothetical protein